jgi:hypothetical protein
MGNVDYDIKNLVQAGNFEKAKDLMVANHYLEESAIAIFRDMKPTENILNFINSFEKPNWKHYVPFLNKESTFTFLDFAQKNHINLFEKINENNDARIIDINMTKLTGYYNDTSDFFNSITTETISKALLQEDTFLIVKQWLEKYVNISDYNNRYSSTHILLDKLNTPGLLSEENYQKIFTRSNFTKQLLELNSNDAEELFKKYSNLFKNKEELIDTRVLLSFYHHGELNDYSTQKLKEAIKTKKFNPNYDLLHETTQINIQRGEFGFSLMMDSPKYDLLKQLLDNNLLPTNLYNCPDNDREPTFFERFFCNNIRKHSKKNDVGYLLTVVKEVESLQQYGVEKKSNLTSREKLNDILEEYLGIEEDRGFFRKNEKIKINKDIEELARDIGFHPVQAQKLVEFLDKRYNFTPDLEATQRINNNEKQIREIWNDLMSQINFTQELESQNKKIMKP